MTGKNVIYALTEPDGTIRYVGQTIHGLKRPQTHRYIALKKNGDGTWAANQHVCRWIRKLVSEGKEFGVTILEEIPEQKSREELSRLLNCQEMYWIQKMKDAGFDLTNSTAGGDGNCGWKPSPKTLENMSRAQSGSNNPMYGKGWKQLGEKNPMYGKGERLQGEKKPCR